MTKRTKRIVLIGKNDQKSTPRGRSPELQQKIQKKKLNKQRKIRREGVLYLQKLRESNAFPALILIN